MLNYLNNFFIYSILFFIHYFLIKSKKLQKNKIEFEFLIFVIIYNLLNLYTIYKNNYLLFWDNQYLFHKFSCNSEISTYLMKLDNSEYYCPSSLGFGIMQDVFSINIYPWLASIIVYIFSIFSFFLIYFYTSQETKLILLIFFVSPGFIFLLNSLNSDILILIFSFYLIINKKLDLNNLDLIVLTLLIQLKIYPIALIFGYLLFSLTNFHKRNIFKYSSYLLLNIVFLTYYFIFNTDTVFYKSFLNVPIVYAPLSSFGLIGDYYAYLDVAFTKKIGNFNFLKVFLVTFLLIVLVIKLKNILFFYKKINNLTKNQIILFTPMVIFVNFFGNHGYKFVFNFLIIYLCYKFFNINEKNLVIIYLFFIPINYILTNNSYPLLPAFSANIYSTSALFISRLFFYLFNFYLIITFLNILNFKLSNKKINFK